MKHRYCLTFLLVLYFLISLTGCQSGANPYVPPASEDISSELSPAPSLQTGLHPVYPHSFGIQIPYTHNMSSITYVTSADQLPDHEALTGYDDVFFQHHALIIIYESVASSSTRLGIHDISIEASTATVKLFHDTSPTGTSAMATWMLWAEVDAGLNYSWHIQNPALKPDHPTQ